MAKLIVKCWTDQRIRRGRDSGVIGGLEPASDSGLDMNEEYDPATETWTAKAPMPTPRMLMSTSVVDGIIHAIGGAERVHGTAHTPVEAYDPATDTWTTKAPIPVRRTYISDPWAVGPVRPRRPS